MNNEGQLMRADTPQQEPSIGVMQNNSQQVRDTITDIEAMVQRIEDFLQGPRPEKEHGGAVESCPSGILAQVCQLGASNVTRLQDVHRRLDRMAANLGVDR